MGIIFSNKELSINNIDCGGNFNVRFSLTAAPDIITNPTDIVLVLDRSGSMAGTPLENLKEGAKTFIEIIDESTDGSGDGQIGNGSRIGIVSFSDVATDDTGLITSVADLDAAIDSLVADGSTNHEDAFVKAVELLDNPSGNAKVIVMFTDGVTTAGGNPVPVANAAKADGVVIYSIGLIGETGLDEDALDAWSSTPSSSYVVITPDAAELEVIFENLARNISNPGATNIVLTDTLDPCFRINDVVDVSKGTADILEDNIIRWQMDELGTTASEGATLEFSVEHVGECEGDVPVNTNVEYTDDENNIVVFPSPSILVECNDEICFDDCFEPIEIDIDGCDDVIEYDAGDIDVCSLGKILELNATIKNVCPNKRIALAVILTEVDENDNEFNRGMKTMVIPAHDDLECRDVKIGCIRFVLPEVLDESGSDLLCNARKFRTRFISHYIDNDFIWNEE